MADAMVLDANDVSKPPSNGGVRTAVLRSSGTIGEGDRQVLTALLTAYKRGMARIQLGDGTSKFDFAYAGNVADAVVCCAQALLREEKQEQPRNSDQRVSGEAFFITNGEPIEFYGFARLV